MEPSPKMDKWAHPIDPPSYAYLYTDADMEEELDCDSTYVVNCAARSPDSGYIVNVLGRQCERYIKERAKTVVALGFLMASVLTTNLSLAFVHDRVPALEPVEDAVFRWLPAYDHGLAVSEYLIMICMYPLMLLLFCHRYRWIIFRRMFLMLGLLYFGRALTMAATVLPVANKNFFCAPKDNATTVGTLFWRALHITSGGGLSINGKHIYCGDFIYSGHTCTLVASYLTYDEYLPKRALIARILRVFFFTCSGVGVVLVTASRIHYTIDVIIALAVTSIVFRVYHTIAGMPELKSFSANNHLSRVWFFGLILFAEQNVPSGALPCRFIWPLPFWPKRYLACRPQCDFVE